MDDEFFMHEALNEAKLAFDKEEVPVGAVLVCNGQIISRAHNLVETLQDASAHAELLCLRQSSSIIGNWRLNQATLYCTLEPCCMCAGAMILSRLSCLVWSAPDLRQGAHGSFLNVLDAPHPIHRLTVRKGVLHQESALLMREFFKLQRKKKDDRKTIR